MMSSAMTRLGHYFHPFQTYVIAEAESERGRFDLRIALQLLQPEADYRPEGADATGIVPVPVRIAVPQSPEIRYGPDGRSPAIPSTTSHGEHGFSGADGRSAWSISPTWSTFGASIFSRGGSNSRRKRIAGIRTPILFGEKEGKIAFANRQRDPLYLFSALQRHLGYPAVPRLEGIEEPDETCKASPAGLNGPNCGCKLLEEEQRGGIDLNKLYGPGPKELPRMGDE